MGRDCTTLVEFLSLCRRLVNIACFVISKIFAVDTESDHDNAQVYLRIRWHTLYKAQMEGLGGAQKLPLCSKRSSRFISHRLAEVS